MVMIKMTQPLAVGNAVRIIVSSDVNWSRIRILRRVDDAFVGAEGDEDAIVVYDDISNGDSIVDTAGLINGQEYHYQLYAFMNGELVARGSPSVCTPIASYEDRSTDALTVFRDRISAGLRVEADRGILKHDSGSIPVYTAPPVYEETRWPVVTVHLQSESDGSRGLGELVDVDDLEDEMWRESEGWLAKVQLTVIGWALNPDERIELRKALRRIIVANLPVFDANGMIEIGLQQQDIEDFTSYNTPVYQVMSTVTCQAPIVVSSRVGQITDVNTVITTNI